MPDVFEEFFHRIGEKIEDHITLTQLDPTYRIFFDDQTIVDMCSDPDRAAKIIDDLEPGALDKFYEYLKRSEFQYEIGMKFVYKNYDNIFDFFTREVAKE
jgi:phytoene desaturase